MGVTQQCDTPQSLDIYQITAAGVFFAAMHTTQFFKLSTSDSFSQSGSHIFTLVVEPNCISLLSCKELQRIKRRSNFP